MKMLDKFETMSHIDIAKVAGIRSDNVKRAMERLVKDGGISTPQIEELKTKQKNGRVTTVKHYMLNRLDSITLMATINGKFCSALVARWDELEKEKSQWISKRGDGKAKRLEETSSIKYLVEYAEKQGSKNAKNYYMIITKMTNDLLGISSGERDSLDSNMLSKVSLLEGMVQVSIDQGIKNSLTYKEVFQLCKEKCKALIDIF